MDTHDVPKHHKMNCQKSKLGVRYQNPASMARFSVDNEDTGGPSSRRRPNPNPNPKRIRLPIHSQQSRSNTRTRMEDNSEDSDDDVPVTIRRGVRPVIEEPETEPEPESESEEVQTSEEETEEEEQEQERVELSDDDDDVVVSEREDDVTEGGNVLTLSDPDVLDCPICLEHFTVPVFQCENGHTACSVCSTKVRNKCPSCALPIGYNRCRAIEKVIESIQVSCRNSKYGCREKFKYCSKNEHEKACTYEPCSCPQLHCSFIGSSSQLSSHFTVRHPHIAKRFGFFTDFQVRIDPNQKCVILQENRGELFIINNIEHQSLGSLIYISCIKPSSSTDEFPYNMTVRNCDSVLKFGSVAENVAKRAECSNYKRFLMVPRDFYDSCGKIKLELQILTRACSSPIYTPAF